MLKAIRLRPGIIRDATEYSSEGGYYDCDLIRFRLGKPESVGGWKKAIAGTYVGQARSLNRWEAADGDNYIGVGTDAKFYVLWSGTLYDVTPLRLTVTLGSDPLTSHTAGSGVIKVAHTAHGAAVGDYVTFSGATAFDGLTTGNLNKEHIVTVVNSANEYEVDTGGVATAGSVAGGGASVSAAYQIPVGASSYIAGSGWGAGPWGVGGWGEPSDLTAGGNQLRMWSQENYGEDLVACPNGGALYYWDRSVGVGTRMVDFAAKAGASNAPVAALYCGVSNIDRHVIALGCNQLGETGIDPMMVRWSDQEDSFNWTPDTDNTAGGFRLATGSKIVSSVQTKQERLIWTDLALYSMRFSGPPYTFGFETLSNHISILSPKSPIQADDKVYWMGEGNFYVYSGAVQTIPCTVREYVFSDINLDQTYKVVGGRNSRFNEVWWFYPSSSSNENDKYVVYNYGDGIWYYGELGRTAWLDSPGDGGVYATGGGYLYSHENGYTADGSMLASFVETADFDIDDGERFMFISRMLPDVQFRGPYPEVDQAVSIQLKLRRNPGPDAVTHETVMYYGEEGKKDLRARGRQALFRVSSYTSGTSWRLGDFRFDIREDGKR
jgi:hypothetical protein